MKKGFLIRLIILSSIVYLIPGLFLAFNQRSFIYYPDDQDFSGCQGFPGYDIAEYNGTRFYHLIASDEQVIIYYHGNAGSACDRSITRHVFEETNRSVIYAEYAGYSGDPKQPTQERIMQDVRNLHRFADLSYTSVIIYGQSLGSGAASYHASLGGVDQLILVSPFSSLADVAQSIYPIYPARLMLRDTYESAAWLIGYNGTVSIIHGEQDSIIRPRFSRALYDSIQAKGKEYILIPDRGHNDLWSSQAFRDALARSLTIEGQGDRP